MAELHYGAGADPSTSRAGFAVNALGAVVSVGLLVGIGVWGYQLVMRDVSGVPVVRAIEGDMRVAPENPGGDIAPHVGLAVNAVSAEGGAALPEDQLVLAPAMSDLRAEDLELSPAVEQDEPVPDPEASVQQAAAGPMSAEDILALADQIAAGVEPMEPMAPVEEGTDADVQVSLGAEEPELIAASVPGVSRSLRPALRPARAEPVPSAVQTTSSAPAAEAAPDLTGPLTSGTKLAQLGAFDSPDLAAREWVRLSGRFSEYLGDKERVIQEAQSGGRTFYRLRAMGFDDLSDARRFCAALIAADADCIPVVVR